jgi:hypothetical protein
MRGYPSCPAASARRLTTPCAENARISCGCHGFEALSSLPQTLTELLGVGSVVHNYVGGPVSDKKVLALFDRLATDYPHWNRTYASGPVRHLLISPCDHGPGDCMYDRKPRDDGFLDDRPGAVVRWQDVDFRSAKRRVAMLTLNGAAGPVNYFQPRLDLRLPAFDNHQCSAFCGMEHFSPSSRKRWASAEAHLIRPKRT